MTADRRLPVAIIDPVGQKAGMDYYDIHLARELIKLSHDVKIYSNFPGEQTGIPVSESFRFSFQKNIFQKFRTAFEFGLSLIQAKKDSRQVVVLHLFHASLPDFLLVLITKLMGFKICIILHDVESFIRKKRKSYLENCLKKASAVIVHNKFTFEQLEHKFDFLRGRLHVIPHGNFIEHPEKINREPVIDYFNLDHSKMYLLFFGMIKNTKGLDVLLDAMPQIDSKTSLIIAGRIREKDFNLYNEKILHNGITERVHCILRYITNTERHYLFSLADITILPYRKIYQSGVLLFSMSYGVPVIASDIPPFREVINGENGLLFTNVNINELAWQINMLINDEKRRAAMSKKAIDFMIEKHSWGEVAKKFSFVLNSI